MHDTDNVTVHASLARARLWRAVDKPPITPPVRFTPWHALSPHQVTRPLYASSCNVGCHRTGGTADVSVYAASVDGITEMSQSMGRVDRTADVSVCAASVDGITEMFQSMGRVDRTADVSVCVASVDGITEMFHSMGRVGR